ncbi:MAG TPA: hypothetical protein VN920_10675 [Pyrinomonadaceae bacterium]|nr:hypothetical protein [Pyrinomonadaceae bacterium]
MKRGAKNLTAVPPESPAKQLAGFIARFDPSIAKLVRAARAILRKRFFPTAVELVYDNYNALAVAFGPTERASDAIVSLAVYARGVNLYFIYGAKLSDPQHLLQGSGNQGRFIRLDDLALFDRPAVKALLRAAIRAAIKDGRPPLTAMGRGYTLIKFVSAKQRPRRPV